MFSAYAYEVLVTDICAFLQVRWRALYALKTACLMGKVAAIDAAVDASHDECPFVREASDELVMMVISKASNASRASMMRCKSITVRVALLQACQVQVSPSHVCVCTSDAA